MTMFGPGLWISFPAAFILFCHLFFIAKTASMMASLEPTVDTPLDRSASRKFDHSRDTTWVHHPPCPLEHGRDCRLPGSACATVSSRGILTHGHTLVLNLASCRIFFVVDVVFGHSLDHQLFRLGLHIWQGKQKRRPKTPRFH